MSTEQSVLKNHLLTLIESLNPEVEKCYLDYSKSKNRVEKFIQIYDDSIHFNKMMDRMFSPEALKNDLLSGKDHTDEIVDTLIDRLLHDLACLNEF